MGFYKDIYEMENEIDFAFLYRQLFVEDDIKETVRDLKINSLIYD